MPVSAASHVHLPWSSLMLLLERTTNTISIICRIEKPNKESIEQCKTFDLGLQNSDYWAVRKGLRGNKEVGYRWHRDMDGKSLGTWWWWRCTHLHINTININIIVTMSFKLLHSLMKNTPSWEFYVETPLFRYACINHCLLIKLISRPDPCP